MIISTKNIGKVNCLLLLLVFLCNSLLGQENPNNFKLGDFLEVYKTDSIRIFYDKNGRVIDVKCADYYRVGKIDPLYCNVKDTVKDYWINSKLMFKGIMQNNALNGRSTYYYNDGKIKEEGSYKNDLRIGNWKYYYPTGRLEKILLFNGENPKILTLITNEGDTIVNNGNGLYLGQLSKHQSKTPYLVYGTVKDSLMIGEWTLSVPKYMDSLQLKKSINSEELVFPPREIIGTEHFENGKFIIGRDRDGTNYRTQIIFTRICIK